MSHQIPFEIQSEIMKSLPVKSLLQFRSVSKQWKSFIDNPNFIKNYHINHTNPQHHLFVCYELGTVQTYTSIVDNNTFPQQKFPLTAPGSISLLRDTNIISSVDGLLCFCGDVDQRTTMVVIWNPSVRKSVGIAIPNPKSGYVVVSFGVCPDTNGHKLVKLIVDVISNMWVVEVFMLSTRVWRTVYTGVPFKSCTFSRHQDFVDGVIYFLAYDNVSMDDGVISNIVISFDLKNEKFGEVCLPERLVHAPDLNVTKVNESLGLLEYYIEAGKYVCGVWTRKDGANKPFNKIYTIKVEGKGWLNRVLGFNNNGEAVIELQSDHVKYKESQIGVYEPWSGHVNGVGINGILGSFSAFSYMETLLLLDQSDSIIN